MHDINVTPTQHGAITYTVDQNSLNKNHDVQIGQACDTLHVELCNSILSKVK